MEDVFKKLSIINVNDKTEKKNGLTYLSWAWAWGKVKEVYPSANYDVVKYDGKPYLYDDSLGYMVSTIVTIEGQSIPMHLPVLDGANKAMKNTRYEYETKYGVKSVNDATMFDINTAIMRCLTKNLAMFGLGHYIYAGEDLPETPKLTIEDVKEALKNFKDDEGLTAYYRINKDIFSKNAEFIAAFAERKKQLQK